MDEKRPGGYKSSGLTMNQKTFVEEYLIDGNATRAYMVAYPAVKRENTAAVSASQLLRNPKVEKYIAKRVNERKKRTEITQDRVLLELARIAFADTTDFARVVESSHIDEANGVELKFQQIELELTERLDADQRAALAEIKMGRNGPSVKLHDKVKALELIGKHLAMFTDKIEQVGDQTITVRLPEGLQPEDSEDSE